MRRNHGLGGQIEAAFNLIASPLTAAQHHNGDRPSQLLGAPPSHNANAVQEVWETLLNCL